MRGRGGAVFWNVRLIPPTQIFGNDGRKWLLSTNQPFRKSPDIKGKEVTCLCHNTKINRNREFGLQPVRVGQRPQTTCTTTTFLFNSPTSASSALASIPTVISNFTKHFFFFFRKFIHTESLCCGRV